jgi:hypothetical protein
LLAGCCIVYLIEGGTYCILLDENGDEIWLYQEVVFCDIDVVFVSIVGLC